MKRRIIFALIISCIVLACSKDSDVGNDGEFDGIEANLQATGASANDLLSNEEFTKLKIEIGYIDGFRPTDETIENFITFIKEYTFKEDIELVFTGLPSPDKESVSLEEIVTLESENRTVYNDGDTLGVYIYFSDAPSDEDDADNNLVTLGAVYRNTSMVIYEETIQRFWLLNTLITLTEIETATLNHEFGHLFGLVNLGSDMVNDHEDGSAQAHCTTIGCLMRAELQFDVSSSTTARSNQVEELGTIKSACSLSGPSIIKMIEHQKSTAKGQSIAPGLDAECILDIQANGGR